MSYVPVDTACSILSKGLEFQVSESFLADLIDSERISLYVRVWDGLARPSMPLVSVGVPTKKERVEHFSKLDDLMEVSPKVFKCVQKRSISESVDYYIKNDFPVSYQLEGLEYCLVDYEKAHWVLSQKDLHAYIKDKSSLNTPKEYKSTAKEPDWVALSKGCWDLGRVLVQAWRIYWNESGNTKPPIWEVLNEVIRQNIGHEYFQGYNIELSKNTFSIKNQHKNKKAIEQSWVEGILVKYKELKT